MKQGVKLAIVGYFIGYEYIDRQLKNDDTDETES